MRPPGPASAPSSNVRRFLDGRPAQEPGLPISRSRKSGVREFFVSAADELVELVEQTDMAFAEALFLQSRSTREGE